MFEKEAEEYQTRKHHQRLYGNKPVVMKELNITYKDGFKDGYNKAKEEMQEQGLALQSDMDKTIEQNIALKKQIEKMKCCQNCRKFNNLSYDCTCAEVCNEWEIKEND